MKRIMNLLSIMALLALTSGCTATWGPKGIQQINNQEKVVGQKAFYVPVGYDGKTRTWPLLRQAPAENSGRIASEIIYNKFLILQPKTIMGVAPETEHEALNSAKQKGLDYVVYSKVNMWVDPMYMACGKDYMDQSEVEISVYDVKTEKVVTLDRIYNSGCPVVLVSFIPIGTTTPEGRFNKVLNDWMKARFGTSN